MISQIVALVVLKLGQGHVYCRKQCESWQALCVNSLMAPSSSRATDGLNLSHPLRTTKQYRTPKNKWQFLRTLGQNESSRGRLDSERLGAEIYIKGLQDSVLVVARSGALS